MIGQERAKRTWLCRLQPLQALNASSGREGDVELDTSNILLLGPPGSARPFWQQTLARISTFLHHRRRLPPSPKPGMSARTWRNILVRLLQAASSTWPSASGASSTAMKSTRSPGSRRTPASPAMSPRRRATGAAQDPRRHHRFGPPQGGRKHPQQDTSRSIPRTFCSLRRRLDGLEKIIEARTGRQRSGSAARSGVQSQLTKGNPYAAKSSRTTCCASASYRAVGRLRRGLARGAR